MSEKGGGAMMRGRRGSVLKKIFGGPMPAKIIVVTKYKYNGCKGTGPSAE